MRILISGASGFVGSNLAAHLEQSGHQVVRLVRTPAQENQQTLFWQPQNGEIDAHQLAGFDGVIHLAGENISEGRWTENKKSRILKSRVVGTGLLAKALAECSAPPGVFISASGISYYGSQGEAALDEDSPAGKGFLPQVCRAWETAAQPLRSCGVRVVSARLAVVLHPSGGILKKLLPTFRLGLGAKLGSGSQYLSWISLGDAIRAFSFCLSTDSLVGPVNFTAPEPITNLEFTRKLGWSLFRPTFFSIPRLAALAALGPMAEDLLFASTRAYPARLEKAGFSFEDPTLDEALKRCFPTRFASVNAFEEHSETHG